MSWAGRQACHLGGVGADRHIRARPPRQLPGCVYLRTLYLLQHAEDTRRDGRTDQGASGATLVMNVRNVGRKGSRQIFGSGWASAESTCEAELA